MLPAEARVGHLLGRQDEGLLLHLRPGEEVGAAGAADGVEGSARPVYTARCSRYSPKTLRMTPQISPRVQ